MCLFLENFNYWANRMQPRTIHQYAIANGVRNNKTKKILDHCQCIASAIVDGRLFRGKILVPFDC